MTKYKAEYQKLNENQRQAVEALSGPIMVVAGPGTGKTQVLAMRIANILNKTDIKADGILCLTFTNSAVEAMKSRLLELIGEAADGVNVSTFHSFGMSVIEAHFKVLGLAEVPQLLEEIDTINLFDEVLEKNSWQYLRPRGDRSRYFKDLRSLISILKRERITPKQFLQEVEKEIKKIQNDPENLSTRGESKGELKKEVLTKIEGLLRSREAAQFFALYEETKQVKNVLDYDDVLENLVKIVETSKDAAADVRERYLYVLVDEHQDSSRVQNEFMRAVWGNEEAPELFVVGDDRQLIYGFAGASIEYFAGFQKTWPSARLITLVDNYRSTQIILDASHALLQSVMTPEQLRSQSKEYHPIKIVEAETEENEIRACAQDIREKKLEPNNCAILLPKNVQVRRALEILHRQGLPVTALENLNLFDQPKAREFIRVLKIVGHPKDSVSLARSLFDSLSGISPIEAHKYIAGQRMRDFSLESALKSNPTLFRGRLEEWLRKLATWQDSKDAELILIIKNIGLELLKNDKELVTGKEILTTVLTLAQKEKEKNEALTLGQFTDFLERLLSYGEHVPVIREGGDGVRVLTLHSSKGLEFDYVWIAHMDERNLAGEKRGAFTLPEAIEERISESDANKIKRKLYVAITRAKRFCTISYSGEKGPARVIAELPEEIMSKSKVESQKSKVENKEINPEIVKLVKEKYKEKVVSASALNNFFECSWKWYFRNFLGLPEAENEHLVFGSRVHAAIDRILKDGKITLPEEEELKKVLENWAKKRLHEISANRESEYSISFIHPALKHLKIYGRVDLIERLPDGSVRITDFKTGSAKKKSEVVKLDDEGRLSNLARQLAMYSYLIENSPAWKGAKVAGNRLEFLEAKNPKDSIYEHSRGERELELLLKDIADYDQALKSGEWISRECHYNAYGKNTPCEYCALAEIFK